MGDKTPNINTITIICITHISFKIEIFKTFSIKKMNSINKITGWIEVFTLQTFKFRCCCVSLLILNYLQFLIKHVFLRNVSVLRKELFVQKPFEYLINDRAPLMRVEQIIIFSMVSNIFSN